MRYITLLHLFLDAPAQPKPEALVLNFIRCFVNESDKFECVSFMMMHALHI